MRRFNVTIRAEAFRQIDEQTAAGETIQSEFQVQGNDALDASDSAIKTFKQDYNACNITNLEITNIQVEPHEEE